MTDNRHALKRMYGTHSFHDAYWGSSSYGPYDGLSLDSDESEDYGSEFSSGSYQSYSI